MTAAPDTELIRKALRKVVDPEVGANIVDLGLIYRIEIDAPQLLIEMTMTSPACPMGEMIIDDAYSELDRILPEDWQPEIRLVWEPPWTPAMMSEKCRLSLGWDAEPTP
ncbi:hydroxylase [Dechloromonas denitrificans]|uniref:Hydroxylase n=1 Tax=Dechloromonas denitrificans TaxID=281362 RepID=A0A133XE52_9RHOO|nr:metal-sulfur cluster assembly factor [Dechloromonas denitrificans]KXB29215.1 hydroxylase [Dechloromonas denitrificans]